MHPRGSVPVSSVILPPVIRPRPVLAARRLLAALALAGGTVASLPAAADPAEVPHALPAAQGDAVARFLADKGLLDNAAHRSASLVQQVRDGASDLVVSAMTFLGVRYRRGGNSAEEGFDCSGFTRHVFERSLGLVLPRRADDQAKAPGWTPVHREELKPGDLVFFNTLRRTFSHVGIYIGEGKFIHAPRSGSSVRIEDMRESYWAKRFTGARRTPLAGDAAMPTLNAGATTATADVAAAPRPGNLRPLRGD